MSSPPFSVINIELSGRKVNPQGIFISGTITLWVYFCAPAIELIIKMKAKDECDIDDDREDYDDVILLLIIMMTMAIKLLKCYKGILKIVSP